MLNIFRKLHRDFTFAKSAIERRQRHYWKNNMGSISEPPEAVRGMIELQRDAFRKSVKVPKLRVREEQVNAVLPLVKKLLLKMEHFRPVRPAIEDTTRRDILLHPQPVHSWESLPSSELEKLEVNANQFCFHDLALSYENWRADEIFKSVLPADDEGLTSYSRIGHIVHLNLRDRLLPYKSLIGEVLRDKIAGCRTVVNKASSIDNTYRNFELELICGDEDYQVETKENGVPFAFDFSKVYWNPRLSTEHERIVHMLRPGDVLYDVFAGVGPFSVPAAKKRCHVLANDLNPESYRWLQHNVKRNKCAQHAKLYNKDGRDFILEDIKTDLLKRWPVHSMNDNDASNTEYRIHITMNLPAMAVEFLDAFRGLFHDHSNDLDFAAPHFNYPTVHVYAFAKGEDTKMLVRTLVEQHLGLPLSEQSLEGISFVRNVAPNKDMYRVSFRLTKEMLIEPLVRETGSQDNEIANAMKVNKQNCTRKRTASKETVSGEVESDLAQTTKIKCI